MRLLDLIFKSKVDRLVAENTRLSMNKQKLEEKTKQKCTSIENKIETLDSRKETLEQIKNNEVANIKRKMAKNEKLIERSTTHNQRHTNLYEVWKTMKQRCFNPNNQSYKNYGGRGIVVCDEWKTNFTSFYKWSMENGYKKGLTIDRIDNNKINNRVIRIVI